MKSLLSETEMAAVGEQAALEVVAADWPKEEWVVADLAKVGTEADLAKAAGTEVDLDKVAGTEVDFVAKVGLASRELSLAESELPMKSPRANRFIK